MSTPNHLLQQNIAWAKQCTERNPDYFERLAQLKNPKYMWIGCSDSRVPANEMIGVEPGMVFVHRNVANQVHHTDVNCLSAVHYAVHVLGVEHIIVAGHYDCGGVRAAMDSQHFGIVDNWIRSIRGIYVSHEAEMKVKTPQHQLDYLCELNTTRQVEKLSQTHIIQDAWVAGRNLSLHGWVYRLKDGLLHDLCVSKHGLCDVEPIYRVVDEHDDVVE